MMRIEEISGKADPNMGLVVQLIRHRLGVDTISDVEAFIHRWRPVATIVISRIKEREVAGQVYLANYSGNKVLEEVMEGLRPLISHRAGFNLAVYQQMLDVKQIFIGEGLTPVFYKGLLLGMDLYGDLTTRFVSDIDILIGKSDFPKMRKLMLSHGYTEAYPYPPRYEDYYLEHTREAMFTKHNRMGIPVSVELQWAPMSSIYGLPDNEAYFLHNTMQMEMAGEQFTTVMAEQQMLLLFIHHGIGDLWRSLRNVTDIAVFLQRHAHSVDWNLVRTKLVEWKMYKNALIGMHLANKLFDAQIPDEFRERPVENTIELAMETLLASEMLPKAKKNFRNMRRQFSYLDDGGSKLRLLLNYVKTGLYPSITDLNSVNLPRILFPLYFLLKPFRFIPGLGSVLHVSQNPSTNRQE